MIGPTKLALGFAGYETPVPGLFHSGSGTHRVAGVCGLPGRNAAHVVLRDLRKGGDRGEIAIKGITAPTAVVRWEHLNEGANVDVNLLQKGDAMRRVEATNDRETPIFLVDAGPSGLAV